MARYFVSYSRVDIDFTKDFVDVMRRRLRRSPNNVWYDDELLGTQKWWETILAEIAACDVFIYLLSNDSVKSPYCQAEYAEATRLQKIMLAVQVRDRTQIPDDIGESQYVRMTRVNDGEAVSDLVAALNHADESIPVESLPPLWPEVTPKPEIPQYESRSSASPDITTPRLAVPQAPPPKSNPLPVFWALMGIITVIFIGVVGSFLSRVEDTPQTLPPTQTSPAVAEVNSPTPNDTPQPTPNATEIEQTIEASIGEIQVEATQTWAWFETATATLWTPAPTIDVRATAEARLAETATQAWVDSWTDTPTPTATFTAISTPNSTQIVETLAANGVTRNADWTPVEREFDGVVMVLVPAGCFMMGSDTGSNDEQPVHALCIEEPFWLDKTEVTQAQFTSMSGVKAENNGFLGESLPVEKITWREAEVYCREYRNGRLPTEAEWEFAGRGLDNLTYPWGNEFVSMYVIYNANSNRQTASVGSNTRKEGASWVGALDMTGNVWEWTSSIYRSYPYNPDDGRENLTTNGFRVIRGSSLYNPVDFLPLTNRLAVLGSGTYDDVGFRCTRSYQIE